MGKTCKGKEKAKAKVAKAKAKIDRKMKRGVAAVVAAFALAFMLAGCSTAESQQPAKSATMNNTFNDCNIIVAAKAKLPIAGTNKVVEAEGGNMPNLELFTQTQSLESTGSTDTFSQTATQTPTTDVKPQTDLRYNDAIKNATDASKGVLESLASASASKVAQMMASKESGTVEVQKKDGSTATVECKDGQCSICEDCTTK